MLDVTNVLNNQEPQLLNDFVESGVALLNPNYNKIIGYQNPRSWRFGAIFDF